MWFEASLGQGQADLGWVAVKVINHLGDEVMKVPCF